MESHLYCAFLFPVVDEILYIGQRATPPFAHYWGPIGGKNDLQKNVAPHPWNRPKIIEKMGGHLVTSLVDEHLEDGGKEYIQGTAVREFCEEIFSDRQFPGDFVESDFTDITRIGSLDDRVQINDHVIRTANYFYIAKVGRRDFNPNAREISGFKPLGELTADDKLFPMAKLALAHMHYSIEFGVPESFAQHYRFLKPQIEPLLQTDFITVLDARPTGNVRHGDMCGQIIYYEEAYFGTRNNDLLVRDVLDRARKK